MTCQCCAVAEARYVAITPELEPGWKLTCALCPIVHGWDSILLRSVPDLLAWARQVILNSPYSNLVPVKDLRAIVGKDVSK